MAAPRRGRHSRPVEPESVDPIASVGMPNPAGMTNPIRTVGTNGPVASAQPPTPPRQQPGAQPSRTEFGNASRRRPRARRTQPSRVPNGRLSLWGCIRGEFVRLFALASTYWLLGITLVLLPAGAAMNAWTIHWSMGVDPQTAKPLDTPNPVDVVDLWISVSGFVSTVAIVTGIFGVLAITSEYSTKSIQATLTANPKRLTMITAKIIAVSVTVFIVALAGLMISWAVVSIMSNDWSITQLSGREWRLPWVSLFGGAAVLVLMALMAFGVGAICRSTPGALFGYIAILTILPNILTIVSVMAKEFKWVGTVAAFMPGSSIDRFLQMNATSPTLSAVSYDYFVPNWWQSLLVLVGWTVVSVVIGALVVRRADIK